MRKIYRYEVPVDGETHPLIITDWPILTPLRAEAASDDLVEFWLDCDDQLPQAEKRFTVMGTGQEMPDGALLLGTTSRTPSGLVWHLCVIGRSEPRTHEYPVGA